MNERGQGTTFAVALTAGVAALWLERFGFAAVQAEARRRSLPVQHLFRTALMATAQRPAGWDAGEMGAGIVDAAALLRMDLGAIPPLIPTENGNPALVEFDDDFKGTPFESEASFVAFDWQIRKRPGVGAALESAVPAIPSRQFAEQLGRTPPADLPAPAASVAPVSPLVPIDDALRRLAVAPRDAGERRRDQPGKRPGGGATRARTACSAT